MNYEILDIETAKKLGKLIQENKQLKEEKEILKERIRILKDLLYKETGLYYYEEDGEENV